MLSKVAVEHVVNFWALRPQTP